MEKAISILRKPSRIILLFGSLLYVTLYSIYSFGGGLGGEFLPVISSLILITATLVAIVATPLFLLLKKEEWAKITFAVVGGFYLISATISHLGEAQMATSGTDGLIVVAAVFGFLFGLCLLGAIALIVLSYIRKDNLFKHLVVAALAGALGFAIVAFVLFFIAYVKWDVNWTRYLELTNDLLVAPVVVGFGYLYFFDKE